MNSQPISFKVGYNFDPKLLDGLHQLNDWWSSSKPWRVGELFGSLTGSNPIGTARPDFRLKEGDAEELATHVARARAMNIDFNYTLNVSMVDPRSLKERDEEITQFLEGLQGMGVKRITAAHPLVMKLVQERCDLPIEISTIFQLRSLRQLDQLKERFPSVDKVCVDVFANRDWWFLRELADHAKKLDVKLELLVNEFCVHECVDRNSCYDIHSLNLDDVERRLFNNYPMGNCMRKRIMEPDEWLWARFVLPQHVMTYFDDFEIASYKISGRTHPTPYVLWVVEQYMKGEYTGNLLELWADVENIGKMQDEYKQPRIELDVGSMPEGFLEFYRHPPIEPWQEEEHIMKAYEAMLRG